MARHLAGTPALPVLETKNGSDKTREPIRVSHSLLWAEPANGGYVEGENDVGHDIAHVKVVLVGGCSGKPRQLRTEIYGPTDIAVVGEN